MADKAVDYEAYWRDLCTLLDEIEDAVRKGEQMRAMRLCVSRFALAEKHGLKVVPLGPVSRKPQ